MTKAQLTFDSTFFFFLLISAIIYFLTLLLAIDRMCWRKPQQHCYHAGRTIVTVDHCLSPKWEGNLLNSDPPLLTTDVVWLSLPLSFDL